MSEERQEDTRQHKASNEPRPPEPQPQIKGDHEAPTGRVAHNQPLLSSDNEMECEGYLNNADAMNLDVMLPVLEEAEAHLTPRTPERLLPYTASAAHVQFCRQMYLPSMCFNFDPRSVANMHPDFELSLPLQGNPQDDDGPLPDSICVPDISRDEDLRDDSYSVRLYPKRRRI